MILKAGYSRSGPIMGSLYRQAETEVTAKMKKPLKVGAVPNPAPNPLLEAFRDEGHVWATRLIDLLEDFEIRLQILESGGGRGRVTPVFTARKRRKSTR